MNDLRNKSDEELERYLYRLTASLDSKMTMLRETLVEAQKQWIELGKTLNLLAQEIGEEE